MKRSELIFNLFAEMGEWYRHYEGLKNRALPADPQKAERVILELRDLPSKALEHFGPKVAAIVAQRESNDRANFIRHFALTRAQAEESGFDADPREFAKRLVQNAYLVWNEIERRESMP